MKIQHTPAPWSAVSHPQLYDIIIQAEGYEKIAVVTDRHDNYEANARLIAAAPELLMALHHAREALMVCGGACDMDRINAVIAEAEGREA